MNIMKSLQLILHGMMIWLSLGLKLFDLVSDSRITSSYW